jgi:hypothetical protein
MSATASGNGRDLLTVLREKNREEISTEYQLLKEQEMPYMEDYESEEEQESHHREDCDQEYGWEGSQSKGHAFEKWEDWKDRMLRESKRVLTEEELVLEYLDLYF